MKRYETFNPTIPELEETAEQEQEQPQEEAEQPKPEINELPPFKEDPPAPVNNNKIRTEKRVKPKKPINKPKPKPKPEPKKVVKVPKEPGPPLTEVIKAWAQSQTTRWLLGLFLGFLGLYLGVSFLTYLSTCVKDQSEVHNVAIGAACDISNAGGEGGARLSEFLINECFGLGSAVIVFWLFAMALKQLTGKPRFKSVDFTIKSLVALVTISLIIGLLTVGFDTSVNWGGYHGRYVNEFIIRFVGWTGAGILCLFLICCFVVICLRDLINWILRIRAKRAERRRKIEEEQEAIRQRERELEEMRRVEEADAAKAGDEAMPESEEEPDDMGHVSFDADDSGLYTSLPDFDELEAYTREDSAKSSVAPSAAATVTTQPQPQAVASASTSQSSPAVMPDEEPSPIVNTSEEVKPSNIVPAEVVATEVAPTPVEVKPASMDSRTANPVSAVSTPLPLAPSMPSTASMESKSTKPSMPAMAEEAPVKEVMEPDMDMVVNVNEIAQADITRDAAEPVLPGMHPYKFPPAELLREGVERISVDANEQMENKERIKKTLRDFGISITSIEATVGPTVTLYEIVPDRGVKINRIRNLVDDIALSLAATGVRIIAPIPGKGTVGIEVANKDAQTVSMRTVIKSHKYQDTKFKLPIALGSTISNEVYIADLAKMPHLLVAGATGQGKSVGLNAIIASLLYRKTPDELKFVMIDPKMVEFSLYAKIEAHYLAKIPDAEDAIITDMDKVVATLSSLCVEMDNRYQLLKAAHTRNIEEYNEKIKEKRLNPLEGHRFLPYIVVVVDEFSDLIMTAGKEVEIPIARLAQKARAVGMHVIIATQRPSTNVITGIIKANFPARIAFKVSSGVDSKTILDTPGAQQLIGRGDMLISNNAPMVRVQCAFIDTPEVEAICDYIERQPYGQGAYELPEPVVAGAE
ncbi:MAG: DNA translocase FtsK, partial [Muribaculaceae bacterium]|nr:DNA translocase FtsK [Muribaculaceae bacterium]